MTRDTVRYYLHNLDGLRQEIADINADLEQYRAMSIESFQVNEDSDPYKDNPDPTIIFPKGKIKTFSNTAVNFSPGHYSDNSSTESLAIHRADFIAYLEKQLFDKKIMLAAINCVLYYLDNIDKKIIYYRYGNGSQDNEHMPWWKAAKEICYDKDTLRHKDQQICDGIIRNYNIRIAIK
jgi:hypothetical protein